MNNTPSKQCERCYKEESWGNTNTLRRTFNNHFHNQYEDLVENNTDNSGHLNKMNLLRWDFRFSNLCNLACTSCSPSYSSTWVPIAKELDPNFQEPQFNNSKINRDKFINTIKTQADVVEEIYFAGGEPLIQSEHYEILEHIDNLNKLDKIDFTYSTNLTSLTFKSTNIIEYWKRIKKLRVLVSLDEIDTDRLHYIRYPAKADKIIENIKIVNSNLTLPAHNWSITPTWSLMNLHRIKDIVGFFKNNDLLPINYSENALWEHDVHNIILMHPEHLSIGCANEDWKKILISKLDNYEEWYKDEMLPMKTIKLRDYSNKVITESIQRFRNSISENIKFDRDKWLNWINGLDKVRNTSFAKTFPELEWHLK
jgi:molybdenum cofactor biosynthesis enzyme MoaA